MLAHDEDVDEGDGLRDESADESPDEEVDEDEDERVCWIRFCNLFMRTGFMRISFLFSISLFAMRKSGSSFNLDSTSATT